MKIQVWKLIKRETRHDDPHHRAHTGPVFFPREYLVAKKQLICFYVKIRVLKCEAEFIAIKLDN